MITAARLARGSVVVALTFGYAGAVFQVWHPAFWTAGLGDWMDPYFINYLMEHWYYSLWRLDNPASPPMFHPTPGTLGYSHGLVLYTPFYIPLRLLLHPFQAYNLAILLVVTTGVLSLYVVYRRFVRLTFVEALLLTAFFAASPNVLNEPVNIWTQRASVYLVPPILLVGLTAFASAGRRRSVLAFVTGLLATLLFTQDFYSAQFTFLFVACAALPAALPSIRRAVVAMSLWSASSRAARLALSLAGLAGAWTMYLLVFGGGTFRVLGVRIASNDPARPAVVLAVSLALFVWLRRDVLRRLPRISVPAGTRVFLAGAALGVVIFLAIYLPVYLDYPGFAPEEFRRVLKPRDPSLLLHPLAFVQTFEGFATLRPFALIAVVIGVAWTPRVHGRGIRLGALLWTAVSLLVWLVPFQFGAFSVWESFFRPLPGFNAIRDPLRIIYQFELAVALAAGLVLSRLRPGSPLRLALAGAVAVLMLLAPNRTVFEFNRPNADYDRWVAAPIRIDPECASFVMTVAPPEYVARSPEPWTLYSNDAMFISLRHDVPTLHGVSAWTPPDWRVRQPHDPEFADGVRDWIARHHLQGVCAMEVERRTMTPLTLASPSMP